MIDDEDEVHNEPEKDDINQDNDNVHQDNREEDDGMYTCTVANAHGSINHTIKVIILIIILIIIIIIIIVTRSRAQAEDATLKSLLS